MPAGTHLAPAGSITVTTPGTVLDSLDIQGKVWVKANNVTISRSRVTMHPSFGSGDNEAIRIDTGVSGTLIIDVEIDGGVPVTDNYTNTFCIGGWNWGATVVTRVNCHNIGVLAQQPSNAVFSNSWVHDLQHGQSSGTHTQAIAVQDGWHVVYDHMTIDGRNASTAPIFVQSLNSQVDDVLIENSLVLMNPHSYYFVTQDNSSGHAPCPSNVRFINNRWSPNDNRPQFNFVCSYSVWSGNVWDDTGDVIPHA